MRCERYALTDGPQHANGSSTQALQRERYIEKELRPALAGIALNEGHIRDIINDHHKQGKQGDYIIMSPIRLTTERAESDTSCRCPSGVRWCESDYLDPGSPTSSASAW